ncbi:ATP synthase F1 subunit epsilon [Candidatus Gracilibacteria bacterium GN02-872]|nr:ATP synthase F1 subunit epsilon [Candidatus Gracilibacteria bacterium GN02-872]RKW24740.1 MAG: ATP synthase F1 subunit epsilon [Candidatus Gracilibacteria bacterium]
MKLQIFSFSGKSFASDSVVSATLMTTTGEITILDNHSPLLTSMKPSNMTVIYMDNGEKKEENFAIGRGIVEVSENNVKVMADMLIDMEEIDVEEAENARKRALELMEKYSNSQHIDMEKYIEAEDMLLRSVAQLKLHKL